MAQKEVKMIEDNNQNNSAPIADPLPHLNEMGEIPRPKTDPHPPIIIPKAIEKDEELYEEVHDRRRRAIMREKLTGITLLFFIGMMVLLIALVNGMIKSPAVNQKPLIPGDTNKPIESYYPVPAPNPRPAAVPSVNTSTSNETLSSGPTEEEILIDDEYMPASRPMKK